MKSGNQPSKSVMYTFIADSSLVRCSSPSGNRYTGNLAHPSARSGVSSCLAISAMDTPAFDRATSSAVVVSCAQTFRKSRAVSTDICQCLLWRQGAMPLGHGNPASKGEMSMAWGPLLATLSLGTTASDLEAASARNVPRRMWSLSFRCGGCR